MKNILWYIDQGLWMTVWVIFGLCTFWLFLITAMPENQELLMAWVPGVIFLFEFVGWAFKWREGYVSRFYEGKRKA